MKTRSREIFFIDFHTTRTGHCIVFPYSSYRYSSYILKHLTPAPKHSVFCLSFSVPASNSHISPPFPSGTKYHESEPVFPAPNTEWDAVFPDGSPIKKDKKPAYVFVWKTWGERGSRPFSNSSLKVTNFLKACARV